MIKKIGIALMFLLAIGTGIYFAVSYHGPKQFTHTLNAMPSVDAVINNAQDLIGTLYDPLMGMHNNIGGRMGFIVCSDVPNIAYGRAGYSFVDALNNDFAKHKSFYNSADGNNPKNPYFHRRARNLYAFFQANENLAKPSYKPQVGDLAFYKKAQQSYVSHVALVSKVTADGYYLIESAPKTVFAAEVSADSPLQRGWLLLGFGKMNLTKSGPGA